MKTDYVILIPSFNSSVKDIKKTLISTPSNANILIVDDGSDISFQDNYNQANIYRSGLQILRLEKNVGIENALRLGVEHLGSSYQYIARLDIGDDGDIERFSKCKEYLDTHKDHVMVGTWGNFVDENGKVFFVHKPDVKDEDIRNKMFINNIFIHPSVMMRTSAVLKVGNYRKKYQACEDYDLFFRLMKVGKVANIPLALLNYTVDYNSISSKKRKTQIINRIKIICSYFSWYGNGFYPYFGLIRNIMMLIVSRELSTKLRTLIRR
ncbi:TPA: glycosyltransferase [Raoultella planticola]|uniref:glycosyltransferase n=1 Tax=Raoultella planticola TaxID=575 RepID=UPI00380CFF59